MDLNKLKEIDELEDDLLTVNNKIDKLNNKGRSINTSDYVKQVITQDTLNKKRLLYNKTIGDYNTHRVIYNELKFIKWKLNILIISYIALLFIVLFIVLFKVI